MNPRADEISAEYLVRHVPNEWQHHEPATEYVSPWQFVAGWIVVLAVVAVIWGLV